MVSVCNCYCCGDHDGWIIVLYTPSTLHCWKMLFIYLWVCEDESSTSGLILYPQRNCFLGAAWISSSSLAHRRPFHEQLKRKCFKMCSKIPPQNLQYKDAKESENEKQPLESSENTTKVMKQFILLCKLGISHERYLENIFIDIYWKYWKNM